MSLSHLLSCLLRRRASGQPRSRKGAGLTLEALLGNDAEPETDDEPVRGCGWFDSSQDLREGLRVEEDPGRLLATLAQELPLDDWLEWHGVLQARPVGAAPVPAGVAFA